MRQVFRRLASVKPARYLEPGHQTGLTGVYNHPTPRSTLILIYSRTLEKLKDVPEHSLYRQSVEALTKHRLAIIEAAKPAGHEEWQARTRKMFEENREQFDPVTRVDGAVMGAIDINGQMFYESKPPVEKDEREEEWDGEIDEGPSLAGPRSEEEWKHQAELQTKRTDLLTARREQLKLEPEPQLTADQISELEHKIGAGLIEEVIDVAKGELRLVDSMVKSKVWEDLEEKPLEGQWVYFERKA